MHLTYVIHCTLYSLYNKYIVPNMHGKSIVFCIIILIPKTFLIEAFDQKNTSDQILGQK